MSQSSKNHRNSAFGTLAVVPDELIFFIFKTLRGEDVCRLCQVSKGVQSMATDEVLWHSIFQRDFPKSMMVLTCPPKERFQLHWQAARCCCDDPSGRITLGHPACTFRLVDETSRPSFAGAVLRDSAEAGNLSVVRVLVDHGAALDERDQVDLATPLMRAAAKGHLDVVKYLLEAGAEACLVDYNGHTALQQAAKNGFLDVVEYIADTGVDVFQSSYCGDDHAMMLANEAGHWDVVLFLASMGGDVDEHNYGGWTYLMGAACDGDLAVVVELVGLGADVNARKEAPHGNEVDEHGYTALMFAAESGHEDIVRFLAEAGAEADVHSEDGYTALMAASEAGHVGVVEYLATRAVPLDGTDETGATALMKANCQEVAACLVQHGAALDVVDEDGMTALMHAVAGDRLDVVQCLVEEGAARLDIVNANGETALMLATREGLQHVVYYLAGVPPVRERSLF